MLALYGCLYVLPVIAGGGKGSSQNSDVGVPSCDGAGCHGADGGNGGVASSK